jgi:anti-sigma B factor antagonist
MPMRGLDVHFHEDGEVTIVLLLGKLDSAIVDEFDQRMRPVVTKKGARVVLDCRGLSYICSRGIGLIVGFHQTISHGLGRFALCNLTPKLVEVTKPLNLTRILAVYPTREAAVAAVR